MAAFFQMIEVLAVCGMLLLVALMVLAHMPQSPLRALLVQIAGWTSTFFCGAYTISPVDALPEILLGPFGLADDLIALVVGVMSVSAALQAGKDRALLLWQQREAMHRTVVDASHDHQTQGAAQ